MFKKFYSNFESLNKHINFFLHPRKSIANIVELESSILELGDYRTHLEKQIQGMRLAHERALQRSRSIFGALEKLNFHSIIDDDLAHLQSQLGQDLLAYIFSNQKHGGFFVEFGATNGIDLSNSYFLEKFKGWQGILAEPGKVWHNSLRNNRKCALDNRAVWSETGVHVSFLEADVPELSTFSRFESNDFHERTGKQYLVTTVSLNDLLEQHGAPKKINFISIDTEGSEFEILRGFRFDQYKFDFLAIEHNFNSNRERIKSTLEKHGYIRVLEKFSSFDDWYVSQEVHANFFV
jgi:FkbM family methyltransferase